LGGVNSGGVTIGGVTIGGVTIGGVTSGFRQRRRYTEAASVTPSPLVFRPARSHDSRLRRRRCDVAVVKQRFFYFAVVNVMYEKLIVSKLLLIISIYIHSTYKLKMDSRISTNGSGKNDAEDFFILFSFFQILVFLFSYITFFFSHTIMLIIGINCQKIDESPYY